MTSEFFERMVEVIGETIEFENAQVLLEQHCDLIGKHPDELQLRDGGLLAAKLMSNLSDILSEEEWGILDERIKHLLRQTIVTRSKVKGFVLKLVQEYIALKRGKIALNEILASIDFPAVLRTDSWYPVNLLEELLLACDKVMRHQGDTRAKAIGRYVVSAKSFRNGERWFGTGQPSIINAFDNIGELLTLDDFVLEGNDDGLELYFKDSVGEHFKAFLLGICQGICGYWALESTAVELVDGHDGSTEISLTHKITMKVVKNEA